MGEGIGWGWEGGEGLVEEGHTKDMGVRDADGDGDREIEGKFRSERYTTIFFPSSKSKYSNSAKTTKPKKAKQKPKNK